MPKSQANTGRSCSSPAWDSERAAGFAVENGGESGIRTHVTLSSKHAFQACAFSHSAISPAWECLIDSISRATFDESWVRFVRESPKNLADMKIWLFAAFVEIAQALNLNYFLLGGSRLAGAFASLAVAGQASIV